MKLTSYHKSLLRKVEKEGKNYQRNRCDEKTEMIIRAVEKSKLFSEFMKSVIKDFDYFEKRYRFSIEECAWIERLIDQIIFNTCIAVSRNEQVHVVME